MNVNDLGKELKALYQEVAYLPCNECEFFEECRELTSYDSLSLCEMMISVADILKDKEIKEDE